MSRYVDRVRILVAYVVARGGLRHAARVVCPVWLAVFTLLTGTATSFQATAQDFASCPAPQKLIWGGGGTDIRTDGPVSSDCWSRDQHPNYIWGPPILYPSPGPWAARVSGECTGSGYHVVLWSGVRACFGGEACMDASIDGQLPNPDSTTAQLLPGCVNTSSDNTCPVGKPVQPGSGAKVFVETDYRSASG